MTPDEAARERIRSDLGATLVVEASAGTGKTTELVRRIVAVLAGGADVSRVAAVTFTDKAAGELKLRLRTELEIARRGASGARLASLERALSRLEEARVSTIHTFAADLLRERPVEAGVDPGFVSEAETRTDLLFEEAFDAWFERALEAPPPGVTRALVRHTQDEKRVALRRAADTLRRLRHLPAPWELRPWSREASLERALADVAALAAITEKVDDPRNGLFQDTEWARAFVLGVERRQPDPDELEAALVKLSRTFKLREPRKGRPAFGPSVDREAVLALHAAAFSSIDVFARSASAELAVLLRGELGEVLAGYEELKRRRGLLDFDDLLLKTRELLTGSPDARRVLQGRLTHVFVDEFQDTDPVQASILLAMCSEDPEQDDPLRAPVKPGKLFIVGDPKQSIYRFRNADLGTYEIVKARITEAGGSVLHLLRSFRSVRGIQSAVNEAFQPFMTGDARSLSPSYAPLEPFRDDTPAEAPVVLLPVPKPYGSQRLAKAAVKESLPVAIAAFLDWLINQSNLVVTTSRGREPIKARHVAVLFKQMESVYGGRAEPIAAALSARRIHHVLVGGRSFYEREEIVAVLTLFEAVERPDDALFVVAALRGVFFGLTDDAIFEYRLRYGHVHPLRAPITALPQSARGVADALELIARLHRLRNRRPFAETLAEMLDRTRAHVSLALFPGGEQALANVHHLMGLREEGVVSFRGFVESLRDRAEKRVSGEAPILEEDNDGVRMMTVHKAKGLEFPVVVLADLTSRLGGAADRHVDVEKQLGAARIFDCSPWELLDHEAIEADRERAEGVRVAYVAATRARDLLVVPIVGDNPTFPDDGWLSPLHATLAKALKGKPTHTGWARDFGDDSVILRPPGEGPSRSTVAPGVYESPELGRVIVWDPNKLDLDRPAPRRVRGSELISNKTSDEIVQADRAALAAFVAGRAQEIAEHSRPSLSVVTATAASHDPPGVVSEAGPSMTVAHVTIPRAPDRPRGARFGDLVHKTLASIELTASSADIEVVTRTVARLVGATRPEEIAAIEAARSVARHPMWGVFTAAEERGELRREVPVARIDDRGEIVEGVIDVAYAEDGEWTVVDFKTDAPEPGSKTFVSYAKQVSLYAEIIRQATGKPTRAMLFFI